MNGNDLQVTWSTILSLCGGIAVIGGATTLIFKMLSPFKKLQALVERHDQLLKKDDERLKSEESSSKMVLKILLVMLNHMISGNGIDGMKAVMAELQNHLVHK